MTESCGSAFPRRSLALIRTLSIVLISTVRLTRFRDRRARLTLDRITASRGRGSPRVPVNSATCPVGGAPSALTPVDPVDRPSRCCHPRPPRDFEIEHCAKQGVSNAGSSPAGGGFFPYTNLHSKVS